jgi:hypothetical protein
MSVKIAPSLPPIVVDSNTISGDAKLVASSGREVDSVMLTSGGGASVVSIYDVSTEKADSSLLRIQIAANQGESVPYCPAKAMPFVNGIYIVFEQGGATQGGASITIQVD